MVAICTAKGCSFPQVPCLVGWTKTDGVIPEMGFCIDHDAMYHLEMTRGIFYDPVSDTTRRIPIWKVPSSR